MLSHREHTQEGWKAGSVLIRAWPLEQMPEAQVESLALGSGDERMSGLGKPGAEPHWEEVSGSKEVQLSLVTEGVSRWGSWLCCAGL